MSTMQIVFSIIGLVLIAAIIGHGVWTIRRNEKAQQQRAAIIEQKRRQVDNQGFDDDGVGKVRVVKQAQRSAAKTAPEPTSEPVAESISESRPEPRPESIPEPRLESIDDEPTATSEAHQANGKLAADPIRAQHDDDDFDLPEVAVEQDELLQRAQAKQAAAQPKPAKKEAVHQAKPQEKTATEQPAQQSMDLPLERSDDEPIINEEPDEVIVLHVAGDIQGAVLLQQMTELGFKFGDFDIFHRHVDTAGNGPVLFSLANMYNPGSFNIDTIETFQTDGLALFLALPIKSNSLQAFTMMHNAAVKLAAAVGRGQVLDEHRNPLTRQAVQHIHQRIREFERKRLIKHSS